MPLLLVGESRGTRLNNYDTDVMIPVLEAKEDRLYAWPVLGSPTVVRENLDESIEYVSALRKMVSCEGADYVRPFEIGLLS